MPRIHKFGSFFIVEGIIPIWQELVDVLSIKYDFEGTEKYLFAMMPSSARPICKTKGFRVKEEQDVFSKKQSLFDDEQVSV